MQYWNSTSWTPVNLGIGTGIDFYGVAYYLETSGKAIVVGESGNVGYTSGGDGLAWTTGLVGGGNPTLHAVAVEASAFDLAIAVGAGGAMFKSIDDGVTWTALTSGVTVD